MTGVTMMASAVPAGGDTTLSAAEQKLRATHWAVVTKHAHGAFLEPLRRMHDTQFSGDWRAWFPNLTPPVPRLSAPSSSRALGQYSTIGGDGLRGEILIRRSLLTGEHPMMRPGDEYAEGRFRYVLDVLLHESVHAYQHEVARVPEPSFHGHGPAFAATCNRIGAALGLGAVRSSKKRGPDAHLPSGAQWPHNVRPAGYYLGALADVPTSGDKAPAPTWAEWYTAGVGKLGAWFAAMPGPPAGESLEPWLCAQIKTLPVGSFTHVAQGFGELNLYRKWVLGGTDAQGVLELAIPVKAKRRRAA